MQRIRNLAFLLMVTSVSFLAQPAHAFDEDNCSDNVVTCEGFSFGPCSRSCDNMMNVQCPNFCGYTPCSNQEMDPENSLCLGGDNPPTAGWCDCKGPI